VCFSSAVVMYFSWASLVVVRILPWLSSTKSNALLILLLYVDDIIFMGNSSSLLTTPFASLHPVPMKDLGDLH